MKDAMTENDGARIWEKLTEMAESGDCRAMKLYYELLEKKNRSKEAAAQDVMHLAEIRRAVFGDAAVLSDLAFVNAEGDFAQADAADVYTEDACDREMREPFSDDGEEGEGEAD